MFYCWTVFPYFFYFVCFLHKDLALLILPRETGHCITDFLLFLECANSSIYSTLIGRNHSDCWNIGMIRNSNSERLIQNFKIYIKCTAYRYIWRSLKSYIVINWCLLWVVLATVFYLVCLVYDNRCLSSCSHCWHGLEVRVFIISWMNH